VHPVGWLSQPHPVVVVDVDLPGVWCSGSVLEGLELISESTEGENLAIIFFIVNAIDVPILIKLNAQQFIFPLTIPETPPTIPETVENLIETKEPKKKPKKKKQPDIPDPEPLLLQAFEMVAKEEEWVHLSAMGYVLHQLKPAFDPRTFGHERLLSLIKDYPKTFAIKRDDSKTPPVVYVALTAQQVDASDG